MLKAKTAEMRGETPTSDPDREEKIAQILADAHKMMEGLRAQGWTREDFARALGQLTGVEPREVSSLAPQWFRDEWLAGGEIEASVISGDNASRGVVMHADEQWITVRCDDDDMMRHEVGLDLTSYRWTDVTGMHRFEKRPEPRPPVAAKSPEAQPIDATEESFGDKVELSLVAMRLRMKADGARWAGKRRWLIETGAGYDTEIAPTDAEIIRRAKEIPGCYLWTNGPNYAAPENLSRLDVLADCYEICAHAVELVQQLDAMQTPATAPAMQRIFQLMAEAQSTLRVAVAGAEGPEDSDQFEVFQWLKTNTRTREIYVARHMRVNDPGDPAKRQDLAKRIADFAQETALL